MTPKENNQWFIVIDEPYKWVEDIKINNIMTPKERATKLRLHYSIILNLSQKDRLVVNSCLRAVNLVINSVELENVSDNFYKYWQEVKNEIEKL